ncbi:autoinducer 2 sensor kinase/phosphatase LuxQ [Kordia sp. SMS9]|uniref:tetratricopeptide repeat-containing hybrid sensor histidine kinase/response regulator n=1 Tax=Kordia sp. SMS9 TaxID=2282170 RepID=UPI000E0D3AD4|nr:response regulator [Kordia sp. SMS9]AXG70079.1 autoinducer 2 sensor kinase/phosphatase LuxQ [Kordia sp. SMS9]
MTALRVFLLLFVFATAMRGQTAHVISKDSIITLQKGAKELFAKRKFNEAIRYSERALKHASSIKNDSLIAEAYCTLGMVYIQMQFKDRAIENFDKAIVYFTKKNNTKRLMQIHSDIGYYLFKNDQADAAESHLKLGLALSKNFKADISSIKPKYYIGQLFLSKEAYDKAKDCFQKVIAYCNDNPNYLPHHDMLQGAYYFSGKASFLQGNLDEAETFYKNTIAICDASHKEHLEVLSLAYQDLTKIHAAKGEKTAELEALAKHIEAYENFSLYKKEKLLSEIVLKYGIDEYEDRLEAIEADQETKELYIDNFQRLTTILVVILVILVLLTGVFYLNQRARVRTNALLSGQNKQLIEAKKRIENVSKIRTNFFSLISHELRTPLYAIIGMTNLLLLEKPEKFQEKYLKSLKFSGEHLLAIINNILQMNKVEASKTKAIEENVDLRKNIKNVITSVNFLVKENRNIIEVKIDENIPSQLLGDSLKISQILFNLLDNAVRYNMEANIRLRIKQVAETAETVVLKFSVKDNGLGIPQQKKHVIFENLEKGIILTEDNGYLDLGLGLSTVNNLLKVLKSKLHLRSVLNRGSEFYFELELRKVEIASMEEDVEIQHKTYNFKDISVLIVDDNAVNGLLTQKILERQQIQTKVVLSGFSALDIIEKQKFDLILMDMFMPKLNGLETIEKIRENNHDIPIILLTAMEVSDAYAKAVNTTISGVISKPFEPEMLYGKIDDVIHQASEE